MKTILFAIIGMLALAGTSFTQVPVPVQGWPYVSRTLGFRNLAMPRLDSDISQHHLFFNTLTGEIDKFFPDGSFPPNWPVISDTTIFGKTPIVVDIDHDGRFEVVTHGARRSHEPPYYRYSLVYLIDDDGAIMPGFPFRVQHPMTLNVVDLDDDHEYEIISYGDDEDLIHCVDRWGNPKPGWPVSFHLPAVEQGYTRRGAAIGDLDLDGANEIIIQGIWGIYAFKNDGTQLPGFPILLQDTTYLFVNVWLPPTLADIDSDGYLEIMTSGDNWSISDPFNYRSFVAIYSHDGQMEEGWPIYFERDFVHNAVTPADIDGDGTIEFGFLVGRSYYYMTFQGDILPGWPSGLVTPDGEQASSESDLITVDIDGDGDCEIFGDRGALYADSMYQDSIWHYGHGLLFGADHLGLVLPGYPIEVGGMYFGIPPTFALDRLSNRLYMTLATDIDLLPIWPIDTLFVELYQFPDSTGPTTQWPMLGHDNLMTRNYNFVDRVTSINDEGGEILPKNYILKQNYPNPFNYSTIIEFILPKEEHVTLTIYDILGRKLLDIYDQVMTAGTHRHRLSMDVPSGIYLYRLKTEKAEITRKMALVK